MKNKITCLLVLFAVMIGATAARGEVPVDKRWYVAPGINYIFADDDRGSDNDYGFRLGIGRAVSSAWDIELDAMVDTLSKDTYGDYKQKGMSLNALYFFRRDMRVLPYGVIGIGALQTKVPGEKSTNLMAELGFGLSYAPNGGMALRFEGRHRYDGDSSSLSSEDSFNDWLAGLTLAIPVGKMAMEEKTVVKEVPAPPPAPAPVSAPGDDDGDGVKNDADRCPGTPAGAVVDASGCPKDTDRDGVADYLDKCPGTPPGERVDAEGCPADSDNDGVINSVDQCPNTPAGVKVDSRGCPVDSDMDGVADHLDKCPGTPAAAKVDSTGCPVDSDRDGIADYLDKCPDTKPGTLVDDSGCALPEKVSITLNVEFDTARAEVRTQYNDEIKKLADFMIKYPSTTVEIGGHTDNVGREASNVSLSQRRADAVKDYLTGTFGIDASRISTRGYGSAKPVADNSTVAGRQQNRRVEAVIETMARVQ